MKHIPAEAVLRETRRKASPLSLQFCVMASDKQFANVRLTDASLVETCCAPQALETKCHL